MRFDMFLEGRKHDVALPLAGAHFVSNFLAAAAAAHHLGIAAEAIAEAATHLKAARHRGEIVRLGGGVTLLDDCYNSNPVAVEAAVAALGMAGGRRKLAFLGDMLELGPNGPALHHETGERIAEGVDTVVAVGPLSARLADAIAAAGKPVERFASSKAAAAAAPGLVREGDAVLVKGSRGMQMERVVDALLERFGRADGTR
jgi:UDP-N-acetylmuramoyl-tripeptide--D-alanyl-D-alanine ligase